MSAQPLWNLDNNPNSEKDIDLEAAIRQNDLNTLQRLLDEVSIDFTKAPAPVSSHLLSLALELGNFKAANALINAGCRVPPDTLIGLIQSSNIAGALHFVETISLPHTPHLELWLSLNLELSDLSERLRVLCDKSGTTYPDSPLLKYDELLVDKAITQALNTHCDAEAILITTECSGVLTKDIVTLALRNQNLQFLKSLWTRPTYKASTEEDGNQINSLMKATEVLRFYLERNEDAIVKQVLNWPDFIEQRGVIYTLICHSREELASEVLDRKKNLVSLKDFTAALGNGQYWLCLRFLRFSYTRSVLHAFSVQEHLIELLADGVHCIYAAEMLGLINVKHWHWSLSKRLCEVLDTMIKKSSEILRCAKPLLFLVLMAEFLKKQIQHNIMVANFCQKALNNVLVFAQEIERNLVEEDVLQYYLLQTDMKQRTALVIIAFNGFTELLNINDIGSIISKLWVGTRKHLGLIKASTLYRAADSKSIEDSLVFVRRVDRRKPYIFQFDQWTDSCRLRFVGQAVSTFVLMCIYTLMVHHATSSGNLEDVSADSTAVIYLRISQVWNTGLMLEKVLHFLFQLKTGRKRLIDNWAMLDILMFLQMLALMLELNKHYAGEGKPIYFLEPKYFNALMHGFMLALIWVRLLSVLIPTILYGSLLKMIIHIAKRLIPYFCILFIVYFASAVLFTIFFGEVNPESFVNFSTSFRTLFAASYNHHDMEQFSVRRYFGEIGFGVFILFTYVLMRNFLIAILTNTYEQLSVYVESEYRSTLIAFHNKWKWDENYGILIMLPTPMSWVVTLIAPFLVLSKNPKPLNTAFAKFFFILFVIPQFACFAVLSILYLPVAYIKSILGYARSGTKTKREKHFLEEDSPVEDEEGTIYVNVFSYRRAAFWSLAGPFVLLLAYFRDLADFWSLIYVKLHALEKRQSSIVYPILNDEFFTLLQEFLETVKAREVKLTEFISEFNHYYQAHSEPLSMMQPHRDKVIQEFFAQFVLSVNRRLIDIELMRTLLPKRDEYSLAYIKQAKCVCVPWINQAIENYRALAGGVAVQGMLYPKSYVTGESPQVKRTKLHALNANAICGELNFLSLSLAEEMKMVTQALVQLHQVRAKKERAKVGSRSS